MPHKFIRAALTVTALAAAILLYTGAYAATPAGRWWTDLPDDAGGHIAPAQTLPDFVDLAARLSPAVVNISTEEVESPESGSGDVPGKHHGEFSGPLAPFGHQHSKSLASGFIISKDGYILTNDHAVDNPSKVTVTLQDGKSYPAKVVGHDKKTDIALLKINAGRDLPVAPLGDSDQVRVGEWVMAIGNPFGFDHSVTAGIVSAKGRFIPDNFDQFLQTDASINPGNSGGPLIDLRGAVVGVNSAIYTQTGASMGIGFAIPVNLVKEELPQLRATGHVTRGWLGVYIQPVTPELAQSLGIKDAQGALVAQVLKNGPAQAAGLERGDVITEFDGKPVVDSRELPLLVSRTPLDKTVTIKIIRDRQAKNISASITESHEAQLAAAESQPKPQAPGVPSQFGLRVKDLNDELAGQLGLETGHGVVIASVEPGSSAEQAGLRARDVILEVNRRPVTSLETYQTALKAGARNQVVLLLVKRAEGTLYFAIKPRD
ncbi:MAG TPA: DegQ family serine endoprotease [Candidatus Binataceae bacterium]|nr:DegQ family serine endoprotease [Candidatus Binataceae bacterium]